MGWRKSIIWLLFVGAAAGKPVRLELLKQAKVAALAGYFGTRHALRVRWKPCARRRYRHNALIVNCAGICEQSSLCARGRRPLQFPDI